MAKLDAKSPDAIRIYMLLGGALTGFLLAYFLVVPLMQNTCTWFTARCSSVRVQQGPNNSLLVTTPYHSYFYDGSRYIFAYGNGLSGNCPRVVASNLSPTPDVTPAQANLCYSYRATPDDPACVAGDDSKCSQCVTEPPVYCARAAVPAVAVTGDKFTCDGGATLLDTQECCEIIQPCPNSQQCILTQAASITGGTCSAGGRLVGGDLCDYTPQYDEKQGGFTCDGVIFTKQAQCCLCTSAMRNTTYAGTTDAQGNIFEPTFAVDAATMQLLPFNGGVVCGVQRSIVMDQFKDAAVQPVKVTIPKNTSALDIYQVFDVLRKTGVFKPPSKSNK